MPRTMRGGCWLAGMLGLAALGVGCSREAPSRNAAAERPVARPGSRLVIGLQQEPPLLNNILQLHRASRLINNALFRRFVTYDDSLRLIPDLIIEIPTQANGGIAADHLTYTYHLRTDARWHDGVPVTAEDVRFTWKLIMDPEAGAESQLGWDVIESVETPDPHTVVFHLSEPYVPFVADTFYDEDVLPKHLLAGFQGSAFAGAAYHRQPVGCGPYRFVEWVPGSHIELRWNPDFPGEGPFIETLVFKFVPEATNLALQLRTGEIDGWDRAEVSQAAALAPIPGLRLYRAPTLAYTHVTLNCRREPLSDRRVRRALALSVDRDAIIEHVLDGFGEPALATRHPLTAWYPPSAPQLAARNVDRAAALLEEAGWVDADGDGIRERGGHPLQLTLSTGTGRPVRERMQLVLRDQWRQIGVEVRIQNYEMQTLIQHLVDGTFDMALFSWGTQPEPSGIEALYGTSGGQNFGKFSDADFDRLAAEGAQTFEEQRRVEIYRAMEEILLRQAPVIPLVWAQELHAMSTRLHGFRPNPTAAGNTWNVASWWLSE